MTGLPIEFESRRGCGLLRLGPEVNNSAWDVVERSGSAVIEQLESQKVTSLIVDLSPLDYLGSGQVALLVRVWKALGSRNGKMVVQVNSPVVRDVLKTAGLNRLWQFVDSQAAAYDFLGIRPDGVHTVHLFWPIAAIVFASLSLAAAASDQFRPELLRDAGDWITIGCASIAIFAGLYTAIRAGGRLRGVGLTAFTLGLAASGIQAYSMISPGRTTVEEPAPEARSQSNAAEEARNSNSSGAAEDFGKDVAREVPPGEVPADHPKAAENSPKGDPTAGGDSSSAAPPAQPDELQPETIDRALEETPAGDRPGNPGSGTRQP